MNPTLMNDVIDPQLYSDYQFCKKTIESASLSSNVLNKALLDKLKVLQYLIENSDHLMNNAEISPDYYHLTFLDKSSSARLYIDTVTCLFPRKNNHISNYVRKGIIFIKSGSLRNWKERLMIVNVIRRTLEIYHDFNHGSLDKEVNIDKINLEWVGYKKGKHCFKLQNLQSRNPFKEILFGHSQFNSIREWYELIIELKNTHPLTKSPSSSKKKSKNLDKFNKEKALSDNELERSDGGLDNAYKSEIIIKKAETIDFDDEMNTPTLQIDQLSTNYRSNEDIKELIIPQIFHDSLKNFDLEKLLEEDDFNLLSCKDTLRILQHNSQNTIFKVFYQMNYPLWNVCENLIELKNPKHWNKVIEDMKVLNIIDDQESYMINEIHKSYGKLYYPRDFFYLQSFIKHSNLLITLKKSIKYENKDHKKRYITGTIKNFIEVLFQHPKNIDFTLGVLLIDIDNSGRCLTKHQNMRLTLKYLKQYKNINGYLAQKNFLRSITNNILLYKFPIETSTYKLKNPITMSQPDKPGSPIFNMIEVNNDPLTPTIKINEVEEKNIEKKPVMTSNIISDAFNKKNELNVIYEKSEESKSYDLSTDKIMEKDMEEVLIKENFLYYNEQPRSSKFPKVDKSDYVKLLEIIESNEHSIRSITKHYITHPVKTKEIFQKIYPEHYIFNKDWVKLKDGGLSYHNRKNIDNQKKVAGYLLRKIGKNLLTGRSIMNISMPIDIFDTTSFLERIAYSFTHIPIFLEKAAKTTDIIQQMNYICAAFISTLHMSIDQIKPFNPILGETFQAWIKGSPLYLEQISHHPPISAFQLYGNGYILQGNFEVVAELHANSLTGKELGLFEVYLTNQNRRFYYTSPDCDINGGFAFGQRYVNYDGRSIIFNKEQNLIMELMFNPDKKGFIENLFSRAATPCDYFSGSTYKVTEACMKRLLKTKPMNKFLYYGVNKKTEIVEELNKVRGIWHEYLMIDDKKYWDLKEHVAYELEYETDPLPSDSIYREDANVWKSGNIEKSQMAKEKLEEIQRADRKWRAKLGPKKAH